MKGDDSNLKLYKKGKYILIFAQSNLCEFKLPVFIHFLSIGHFTLICTFFFSLPYLHFIDIVILHRHYVFRIFHPALYRIGTSIPDQGILPCRCLYDYTNIKQTIVINDWFSLNFYEYLESGSHKLHITLQQLNLVF